MKKLFVCLFALIAFSCSTGDNFNPNTIEFVPIDAAMLPDHFVHEETYEITVIYTKPTTCHVYNDIYYVKELNERTVAIITTLHSNPACEDIPVEEEVSFNFTATGDGPYLFKFWQGKDDAGEDIYLEIEVPVL
jgi:hypothetical protein